MSACVREVSVYVINNIYRMIKMVSYFSLLRHVTFARWKSLINTSRDSSEIKMIRFSVMKCRGNFKIARKRFHMLPDGYRPLDKKCVVFGEESLIK